MKKHLDIILLVLGFLLVAAGWWYFWVSPRDEALLDIVECMDDDLSQESYKRCVHQWRSGGIIDTPTQDTGVP